MTFKFELRGLTPLIMHNDNIEAADALAEYLGTKEGKATSKAGDDRTPAWKWHGCLYTDGRQVVIPIEMLLATIKFGASQVRIVDSKPGSYERLSQSGLFIDGESLPLLAPDRPVLVKDTDKLRNLPFNEQARKAQDLGFTLFTKRVVVEKKRHLRVRPKFDQWRASGVITITDPLITPDALRKILTAAGRYAGLGDWRPGAKWPKTPGPYGRFDVAIKAS